MTCWIIHWVFATEQMEGQTHTWMCWLKDLCTNAYICSLNMHLFKYTWPHAPLSLLLRPLLTPVVCLVSSTLVAWYPCLVCLLSGQTEKLAETLIFYLPGCQYWFHSFLSVLCCITLDIFSTCFYLKTRHVTRFLIQLCYSWKCGIVLHLTQKSTINRSALNQARKLLDAEATNLSASQGARPISGSQAHSGTVQECPHTSATLFLCLNLLDLRFILYVSWWVCPALCFWVGPVASDYTLLSPVSALISRGQALFDTASGLSEPWPKLTAYLHAALLPSGVRPMGIELLSVLPRLHEKTLPVTLQGSYLKNGVIVL